LAAAIAPRPASSLIVSSSRRCLPGSAVSVSAKRVWYWSIVPSPSTERTVSAGPQTSSNARRAPWTRCSLMSTVF
jgi:hypothetical protein